MSAENINGQIKRPGWGYLPEIDGLRAIAILSVLVFHFNRKLFGGGFVGVDIFFVISGFLITSILLNDFNQGQFSISRFYQRRIARIAPAFFVVLVLTLVAAYFVYS
ncbi:MAG: acyltransferase, partial [Steroidobacteraceae bacterium]